MSEFVNYGISAGSVSAQNLAVGSNARIDVAAHITGLSEQLAALRHAIESFSGDPQARAELAVAAGEVAEELDKPAPNKERALSRLSRIASVAGSASAIAGAATALTGAVKALL